MPTATWSPAATIVPDPVNPQAYNRYSYCLNNPLRYNDPSGNTVCIYGISLELIDIFINNPILMDIVPGLGLFISDLSQSDLYQAWELYSSVAPEITTEMEDSEEVYNIIYEDMESAAGRYQDSTNTIRVDPDYIGRTRTITSIIAHETVHSYAEGSASVYEEAVAYQYMYEIESRLGINYMGWHKNVVGDINLGASYYNS